MTDASMDNTKAVLAFLGVLAVGFAIVLSSHFSGEDNSGYGLMLDNYKLNNFARENCGKAIRSRLGVAPVSPGELQMLGNQRVTVHWKPSLNLDHDIVCHFEQSQGVTELVVDDQSLGAVSVDLSGDANARPVDPKAGQHWGHW